jgi:hypothetical protein
MFNTFGYKHSDKMQRTLRATASICVQGNDGTPQITKRLPLWA